MYLVWDGDCWTLADVHYGAGNAWNPKILYVGWDTPAWGYDRMSLYHFKPGTKQWYLLPDMENNENQNQSK